MTRNPQWWESEGGFYGKLYIAGDDSQALDGSARPSLAERTAREAQGLLTLTQAAAGAHILDLPCGYGRHALALAKQGYTVVGIDLNVDHIEKARQMAKEQGIAAEFAVGDMRDVGAQYHGVFDLVINMFYSFGYFDQQEENQRAMQEFFNALKAGGSLLLHSSVSPEVFESHQKVFEDERLLKDGGRLLVRRSFDAERKRIIGEWMVIAQDGTQQQLAPYSVQSYSKEDFESMARLAGFKDITFFGSFEGEEFVPDARELIMVAQK